ncbi:peptidase S1 and S6, chymotrypsin/Hap [Thermofilum pendens Hrk 5]|uniref:Peptidase S1 and S6, chymotrypsin/Hap n=1 Tax=Thermofilum pendens (strain DSM 2475 / Hrk 5) TaxID=368408 RepID=A1S0E4_THEPD|nr:peptidase S1 and S6, chymotrypsin/Hap [Thermofilum pendens Hrk 5]
MAEDLQERVIRAYEKVRDSVVSVTAVKVLDFLFVREPVSGLGSGVAVSEDGLVATNAHVVEGFEEISVTTPGGDHVRAEVVDVDPHYDIAFLRVERARLKPAELGDSDSLRVGQFVVAVGNPFGQLLGGPSLTFGVVSGLGRSLRAEGKIYENLIQTDAPVNPGNSGGPLVDLEGRVVGITTAMIPFAQGIGFAIPINEVKYALAQLEKYGRILRPWIGVYGLDVNPAIAYQLGLPRAAGVLVLRVVPGSPAARAGVKPGAVILKLDGSEVKGTGDLVSKLRQKEVGEKAVLEVFYAGTLRRLQVTVEEAP